MSGRMALAAVAIAGMAMATWPGSATASTSADWGMFHHDTLHTGVSPDTAIGAAQAPSLSVKWSQPVGGGPVFASPAAVYNASLAKTLVYEVSVGGTVHAFDTTGASIWTSPQNIGAGAVDSPAVDGNSLYIGSDNGVLTALDATTGSLQCSFALPIFAPETAPGRIEDAPVVGHDSTGPIVYFGDTGQSESVNHGHEWAVRGFGNSNGGCTQRWMHDLATTGAKRIGSWSPPALGTDSTGRPLLVFGSSQPDDAVYALDARDGSLVWRFQTFKNFPDADVGAGPTISAPGVNGISDGVVYIDGKDRSEYAIDLLTGKQLWTFDMQADSGHSTNSVSCAALIGNLVVVAYWKYVYAFNATTGALVWRTVPGSGSTVGSVSVSGGPGDQVVLRGDLSGDEYAYRLGDGALLKTVKVAATRLDASTAVAAGMAFIAGEDGNLYALSEASSASTGSITGTVTDAQTNTAIGGATVNCPACPTTIATTGTNGVYNFSAVPPGGYSLSFSATGYASVNSVPVSVTKGSTTTQDEALTPQPGTITGTVTDAQSHNPITRATVSCPTCPTTTATTDVNGSYTFAAVPEGSYTLSFSATNYATLNNIPVTVSPGGTATQNEAMSQPGSITGTVTDSSSSPIPGATVSCPTCPTTTATTLSDGTYAFSGVAAGSYSLSFSASGYGAVNNVPVAVSAGQNTVQDEALSSTPAFVFSDGFESGDFSAWTSSSGLTVESTSVHAGSFAAQGIVSSAAGDARRTLPSAYATAYQRVWFKLASQSTQVYLLQANTAANSAAAIVYSNSSGFLGLQAADGSRHDSTTAVTANTWHELEIRFTIGTTGSADIWLDNMSTPVLSLSGINLHTTSVGVMQVGDATSHTWNAVFDDAAFDTQFIP